jgi:alanine racemase
MNLKLVQQADLHPIVTWKSRVAYCKVMSKGESVGYGRRPALTSDTAVATLAVGWADGYPSSMSRAGHVLIRGRRCPVISVTANSTLVDATGLPDVAIDDPVVLLGRQTDQEITAAEMARVSGQTVYHLLAAIPRQAPRLWNSGKELNHE